MNNKHICVYDLETDSADASVAQPIQFSALIVEPHHLTIVPDSEFNAFCKPDGFDKEGYLNDSRMSTYEFHAKNRGVTVEEVLKEVSEAPPIKMVFEQFVEHVRRYADKPGSKSLFQAVIPAGFNNTEFDDKIIKRLCGKYKVLYKGEPSLFFWRDRKDIMSIVSLWFEGASDSKLPKNLKLDTLRPLFGINPDKVNAHDGLQDCRDEAELLIRFLKMHRQLYNKVQWPWKKK